MRPGSIVLALRFSVLVKFNMADSRHKRTRQKKLPDIKCPECPTHKLLRGSGAMHPRENFRILHLHCHFLRSHAATDLLKNLL